MSETASISIDPPRIDELRAELDPAAATLLELAAKLHEFSPLVEEPQLQKDLAKTLHEAQGFRDQIEDWFPLDLPTKEDPEAALRSARHDARNQLNHLFGLVQLIQISPVSDAIGEATADLGVQLEVCLALISKSPGDLQEPNLSAAPTSPICDTAKIQGHLLVADDDPENREILKRLLTPCGYELDFAVNGREAIEQMERTNFDAVLLDIEMPEMNGFEVLERLHETGQLRHTPVIVVTGLQEEQDAVRCIEIGAEDFLSRPIRPALLMARLNASLEKKRLREKVFEQHFTPELARELARNPDPMKMQAREAEVTVMFCDIRSFSSISERLGATQTVDWLSGVMGHFSTIVIDHGGVLVDYTGDELLAMWGAPNSQPDHAELACKAAREIMDTLPDISAQWEPIIGAETSVGIGMNTGDSLVGNIGTHRKFKYGPLGTTVNLASRVQGATKFLKTSLLITGNTAAKLPEAFNTRRLCQVRVQNIIAPVDLHELELVHFPEDWVELSKNYQRALTLFEKGEFHEASSRLGDVLMATPNDGPSLQLMSRIVDAMLREGEDFSSIWTLPGK